MACFVNTSIQVILIKAFQSFWMMTASSVNTITSHFEHTHTHTYTNIYIVYMHTYAQI